MPDALVNQSRPLATSRLHEGIVHPKPDCCVRNRSRQLCSFTVPLGRLDYAAATEHAWAVGVVRPAARRDKVLSTRRRWL